MKIIINVLIFGLFLGRNDACQVRKQSIVTKDWWETAQFYQIYPRSFKDSNDDGVGDLNGITSKLEYLKDIGVTAAWLSPIFKSPMVDFGYDISNFYEIQPEYGTMADFENLIKQANKIGIKIILDFVPNHSSDKADWFEKSVNREPGYEDFYIWADGKVDPNNPSKRVPPSNWLQGFRGSAWEWVDKRKQFYLHQFAVQQPDLNYRNPAVAQKMKGVLKYWLDKGIAGFRVDAVPCMFEVLPLSDGSYPDEPVSGSTTDPEESGYLNHIYTQNQPETIDIIYEWRKMFDDYKRIHGGDSKVLLIETYAPVDYTMLFYGNKTVEGAQLPFNFNLIVKANQNSNAKDFERIIHIWLDNMPRHRTANWVIGNHDQRRAASRYGTDKIDTMNMLVMMLPGASVTYQGEELGMIDGYISWKDTKDPAACNSNEKIYEKFTRDPSRTPFHWDDTKNAGFSNAAKTWLPVADSYKERNVKSEMQSERSHLKIYKQLVQLRSSKTLQFGNIRYSAVNENVLVIERTLENSPSYVLVANFASKSEAINLSAFSKTLPKGLKCKIVSLYSAYKIGAHIATDNVQLRPYEAVILSSA